MESLHISFPSLRDTCLSFDGKLRNSSSFQIKNFHQDYYTTHEKSIHLLHFQISYNQLVIQSPVSDTFTSFKGKKFLCEETETSAERECEIVKLACKLPVQLMSCVMTKK